MSKMELLVELKCRVLIKETYEKPLSVRYINYYQFRSEPAAKFVSHVK